MSKPKFHVFLSHNSPDKPAVEELARRLKAEGMEPWLDKWHLIPGDPWQPAIEEVLAECASCAVFIGSGGIGTWQDEEMRAAINRRVTASRAADSKARFRVIPVLLPGVVRPERSLLPAFLVSTTWVEFRATLDEAEPFRRLLCGIRGIEPGDAPGQPILEGECPYRGLEFFDVAHASFFFGREALTEWLLTALRRTPAGQENRFLAILGASGSGKSSLARAGLIPALKAGGLDGSADWSVAVVRPGADPLESLAVALSAVGGDKPTAGAAHGLMTDLRASENTLHLTTRLALRDAPTTRRLVVLVDAFEEVFTLCSDEAIRTAFIDNLLRAAVAAGGQTVVVLTMRADFLGKCATHTALAAAMSDHQALVGPMTEDELRRSIERPAVRVGCELEPGLVDVLIQDVQGQSGALPLMQYALLELWQRRDGRRLTLASYHAVGGLRGALERRANEVLGRFTEGERELCRRIFLRLTQPGEGTEDTKRRASYRELSGIGAEPESVQAVLGRLADARLITTEGNERRPGEGTVDVAHEALIRGWPELRKWIDADRSGLRTQRRLTEAAREWESNGRDASFLYGGAQLAVANEWAQTHRAELNRLEAEFLSASVETEGARQAEEVAKARARVVLERWRLRLTLALAATLLLATVSATVAAFLYSAKADGETKARSALDTELYDKNISLAERELTMRQDVDLADDLLKKCPERLRGWEWNYLMRLRDGAQPPLVQHAAGLWMAAYSPNGRRIATASIDGTVKVWDAASGRVLLTYTGHALPIPVPGAPPLPVMCLAFSPDGRHIASGSFLPNPFNNQKSWGIVKVWDADTGEDVLTFQKQVGVLLSLTYSPDGKRIASSSINEDHSFVVWDAQTGEVIQTLHGHASHVHRLRYSPDGKLIVSASTDGKVRIWDAATFAEIRTIDAHPGAPVVDVAFAPDGARFATAGEDGAVHVWDTATGAAFLTLRGHIGSALGVAYSPDGQRIASGGFDKTVRVWDATTGKVKITLRGHTDIVWGVAFSPDGREILSASFDKTARIWEAAPLEVGSGPGLFTLLGHTDHVNSVAFSLDGRYLASGGMDRTIRLWDGRSGEAIRTFPGHDGSVWGVAFSPDGLRLASAGWDAKVRIWDTATGKELHTLVGHTAPVQAVSFSPDGRRVASASWDGLVKIWDAETEKVLATCEGYTFPTVSVAFSPDGKRVASGRTDRSVVVWDAATGTALMTLKGHMGAVPSVAFSPDGKRLVSASWDHTLKVWDVDPAHGSPLSPNRELMTLTGHGDRVHSVAWSPDGTSIVSGSDDKTVRTWDSVTGKEAAAPHVYRGVVWCVAFSPDGKRIAAACWSDTGWVKTCEAETTASPSH